jgi:hypothetical protein
MSRYFKNSPANKNKPKGSWNYVSYRDRKKRTEEKDNDYESQLDNRIANYETRFGAIGETPPEPEKKSNFLMKALDIIDRPRNAIINAIQDSLTGENSALQGAWEGLTGKEKAYVSDLLPENMNKYAKAGLGFAGDVLADPLTYLTFGAAGLAKGAVTQGGRQIGAKLAGQHIPGSEKILTPLANRVSKVADATGIPDLLGKAFKTDYIDKKLVESPEQLAALQKAVDDIRYLNQRIKGEQQIALGGLREAFKGVTPKAAEEASAIIEAPISLAKKTGTTLEDVPDNLKSMIESSRKIGIKPDKEAIDAARIASRITKETTEKDIQAGLEFGQLPFYIKHVYEGNVPQQTLRKVLSEYEKRAAGFNKKAGFQKERTIDTIKDAEQIADFAKKEMGINLKPIKDVRILTAVREMEGIQQRATNKLYQGINELGETVIKDIKNSPKDWVQLPIKQFQGKAVHPELARHLERFTQTLQTDAGIKTFSSMFNNIQNLWKGYVTTSVPFHLRNLIGNVYNNFLAGVVNPKLYDAAQNIQFGRPGGMVLAGKNYTNEEILTLFRQQGLEGFGIFKGESTQAITKQAKEALKTDNVGINLINPLSQEFAPLKGSRWLGDKIETNSKLAHFIDKLAKGYSPEEAAQSVRKYLFDYADLTSTEEKIKAVVPFYTWTRKNMPLQLESFVTQPGKPSAVNKLVENMRNTQGTSEDDIPDWMKEEMAIPIMVNADGSHSYLMPDIPLTNLNMIGGGETLKNAFGMLSPLAKVPVELIMNKQAFTGAPIEKYEGSRSKYGNLELPSKLAYALSQLGSMPRTAADIAGSLMDDTTTSLSPIPQAPERNPLASIAFGSLMRSVNPDRERVLKKIGREQQLGDFRKYLEEVKGIEVPTIQELNKKRTRSRYWD